MTRRLLVSYLTITVVVLLLLGVPLGAFYSQRERERIAADLEHDASVIATVYEDDLEADRVPVPGPAASYEERTGARVVVVDDAGISRVDTGDTIERDFSTRPEIAAALEGTRTTGTRSSETLGVDLFYVAVPVASGGTVHGAVRLTLDTSEVDARIRQFWLALVGVGVVVLAAVGVIGWVIARSVSRPLRTLTDDARRFAAGDLSATEHGIDGPPEIRELDETMASMARRLDALLTTSAPSWPTPRTSCERRSPPSGCGWRTSRTGSTRPRSTRRSKRRNVSRSSSPTSCSSPVPTSDRTPSPSISQHWWPTVSTPGPQWRTRRASG